MVLVRSGMVDPGVVVGGAHMAVEVVVEVEDLAAEEVVHAVLALYLTSNPMTTVLYLLVDPAAANRRTTFCLMTA